MKRTDEDKARRRVTFRVPEADGDLEAPPSLGQGPTTPPPAKTPSDAPSPARSPEAAVWHSPELLGRIGSFLDPSHTAWSFIRVNRAAAAAFDSHGQLLPRTVSLRWLLGSGLLATPEGRAHARAMCYRLTLKQRVRLLCLSAASGCSLESLGGAVAAAGLSPPPVEVLVSAASAGRLAACRWLVEELGCPGLHRLACLSLLSAAGTAGVAEEALAWLEPGAKEGWSEEQVAKAATGDPRSLAPYNELQLPERNVQSIFWWSEKLSRVAERRDLERIFADQDLSWSPLTGSPEFYLGPYTAQAVARLAGVSPAALRPHMLQAAATAGHREAVRHLLQRGVLPDNMTTPDVLAARGGHLGVLQALHEAGCVRDPAGCFKAGLEAGSLPVASWLVETSGAPALQAGRLSQPDAARSGSVVVMEALPGLLGEEPQWGAHAASVWPAAAASGCEAAVDWLAARYHPDPVGSAVANAARNGDGNILLRLLRLRCSWDGPPAAKDLDLAASRAAAFASASASSALPWLAGPGYPASWAEAAAEARAETEARAAGRIRKSLAVDRRREQAHAQKARLYAGRPLLPSILEGSLPERSRAGPEARALCGAPSAAKL